MGLFAIILAWCVRLEVTLLHSPELKLKALDVALYMTIREPEG